MVIGSGRGSEYTMNEQLPELTKKTQIIPESSVMRHIFHLRIWASKSQLFQLSYNYQ